MDKLTKKQKRFCDEYLIDLNATQAAIRAGYSAKTADQQGSRMLTNVKVKSYIDSQLEQMHNEKTADTQEIIEYLTAVLRGESVATEIVIEKLPEGSSRARTITKEPSERERLKAAELLGKRYGLYTDNIKVEDEADKAQKIDNIAKILEQMHPIGEEDVPT